MRSTSSVYLGQGGTVSTKSWPLRELSYAEAALQSKHQLI